MAGTELGVTYPEFLFLEEHPDAFAHLAATTGVGFSLFAGDLATRVNGLRVSQGVTGPAPEG